MKKRITYEKNYQSFELDYGERLSVKINNVMVDILAGHREKRAIIDVYSYDSKNRMKGGIRIAGKHTIDLANF